MSDERASSRLASLLRTLKPKAKQPVSTTVLNNWIAQHQTPCLDEATAPVGPYAVPTGDNGRRMTGFRSKPGHSDRLTDQAP